MNIIDIILKNFYTKNNKIQFLGEFHVKTKKMLNMKDDMSGAAAVIATMKALSELKPDVEVHGIIAACENMPSGSSYKPGDVIMSKIGKSIEIDNIIR